MKTRPWPSLDHVPQRHKQIIDFLGRQHGGRLVQNDETGAPVERFEDLDALLLADRKLPDVGIRVDLEPVGLR